MIPFGLSGGSQERLMVLADAPIRCTVGTADGAGRGKKITNEKNIQFNIHVKTGTTLHTNKNYLVQCVQMLRRVANDSV